MVNARPLPVLPASCVGREVPIPLMVVPFLIPRPCRSCPRATSSATPSREELLQHRREYLGGHDVFLAFQDVYPPVRYAFRHLLADVDHPPGARPTAQHERGGAHRTEQPGRDGAFPADVAHDLGVVE